MFDAPNSCLVAKAMGHKAALIRLAAISALHCAEARAILEAALSAPDDENTDLGAFARGLFAPLGGVELELPSRAPPRQVPQLGEAEEVAAEVAETPADIVPTAPEPAADEQVDAIPASTRRRRR